MTGMRGHAREMENLSSKERQWESWGSARGRESSRNTLLQLKETYKKYRGRFFLRGPVGQGRMVLSYNKID